MKECILYDKNALRSNGRRRSFTLTEDPPVALMCPRSEKMVVDVIDWMSVDEVARWRPEGGATYCNVYASDLAIKLGAYFPRVWWRDPSAVGRDTVAVYGENCIEMSANRLVGWMREYGPEFGWRVFGLPPRLDAGDIGLVIGRATRGHGHVQALYVRGDEVLATQAGATNFRHRAPYSEEFWRSSRYEDRVWAVHRSGALGGENVG